MTGLVQETQELFRRHRGSPMVDQRVAVDESRAEKALLENDLHPFRFIVNCGKHRQCARLDAKYFAKRFLRRERKIASRADQAAQSLEIDIRVFVDSNEEVVSLGIAQKEILRMDARDFTA